MEVGLGGGEGRGLKDPGAGRRECGHRTGGAGSRGRNLPDSCSAIIGGAPRAVC